MESGIPLIALVGYTNAGKSTLLNALAGSDAYADDRLFATLDPMTRRAYAPTLGREVLLTDTVGFIDRLPTEVVAAFRATLEEAVFADLLALVVDGSEPDWERKLEVVERTIEDIGAGAIPTILVFSKADLYPPGDDDPRAIAVGGRPIMNGVRVSAVDKTGLGDFWEAVAEKIPFKQPLRD
jgi:GTP-binding protein HflX